MPKALKTSILRVLTCLSLVIVYSHAAAQLADETVKKVIARFEKESGFTYKRTIQSVNKNTGGLPNDNDVAFIPGKQMLVVALFSQKPQNVFARMLVTKHFGKKIAYDNHPFQPAAYEESLSVYYSLLTVAFPEEANALNCSVNLQVFDKAEPARKVWLLVFFK